MGPSETTAEPSATATVTFSSGRLAPESPPPPPPPDLRLLHFNDVYHLDPSSSEPVGGVARFVSLCNEYRDGEQFHGQPELVTLFSGDVFNPSLESSVTKGAHMIPLLNKIGTRCACVGNHDLDFGVMQFRHLTSKCDFPWLLANVLDPALGDGVPLGNAKRTHMITASNGIKIGLLGLGEREWLDTINSLPPNLIYRSASEVARELVPQLRADGADVVIALTHQREPNDDKLAENLGGIIDIILGGHDHFYAHSLINGTHVLRSGSDFKQLSYLELRRSTSSDRRWDVDIWRRDVVKAIPEDGETLALVDKLTARLKKSLEKPIGWTAAPLDARFTTVRLRESNLGNFVCDIMRHHYEAECALMAAGTIRGDQIYTPGPVRVKDITDCFPFEDPVVVIKASGKAIWDALENGVSMYPALEGRFPQVSNIRFKFDPAKPPGSRILWAEIAGAVLDAERIYVLATRGYMARGKDGYDSLLVQPEGGVCEEVVSEENGMLISAMLRQYFMSLRVMDRWSRWGPSLDRHWHRVGSGVAKSHPVVDPTSAAVVEESPSSPAGGPGLSRTDTRDSRESWAEWTPTKLRDRRSSVTPLVENADNDTDHEDAGDDSSYAQDVRDVDRELRTMRRVFGKWCRLAGVRGQACDSLPDGEGAVAWTKAISPKVEGRILMVGDDGKR
ncbi:Metallo-dependent phosphatase-like protein [Lasiosphaeria miniovina]|uniref:Metallo-dependent phosphatase-like protein n=1 Tax=Lasiosphaeria miniovina TaxID=1954250 RepID=A0AA40AX17_9PEZI|nr:Metallo-dependent phosphatase-like protein [Lasiosphaeria miniovina]KAK0723540.1 Metallo-dependent phosphatase-like protein [Lasiosphaeria miniovina]